MSVSTLSADMPNSPAQPMSATRRLVSVIAFPFLLSLAAAIACYLSAGPTLGLFLGGLLMVTLLVPPLVMAEETLVNRLIAIGVSVTPFAVVWLFGAIHCDTRLTEWFACVFVLLAYAISLGGVSVGLRLIRCPAIASAALSVIAGLAWMTWPIWLSPTWKGGESEAGVARLVVCHPGITVNGQLLHLGVWTEQSVAYHLTDLSQNVSYSPARHPFPCVLLHGLLGATFFALQWVRQRRPLLAAPLAERV
jgi:hypothetical protein